MMMILLNQWKSSMIKIKKKNSWKKLISRKNDVEKKTLCVPPPPPLVILIFEESYTMFMFFVYYWENPTEREREIAYRITMKKCERKRKNDYGFLKKLWKKITKNFYRKVVNCASLILEWCVFFPLYLSTIA